MDTCDHIVYHSDSFYYRLYRSKHNSIIRNIQKLYTTKNIYTVIAVLVVAAIGFGYGYKLVTDNISDKVSGEIKVHSLPDKPMSLPG